MFGARSMSGVEERYPPYPIIIGPNQPKIRFHGQMHYSLTNLNLFVPNAHLDQSGTYPISAFLLDRVSRGGLQQNGPISLSSDQQIPTCRECLSKPCPMIVKKFSTQVVKREVGQSGGSYEPLVVSSDFELWDKPRLDVCPAMNCLSGLCQTDAERKFLRIYYETAFGGWIEPQEGWFIWADLIQTRVADLDEWWTRQSEIPPKFRDPANLS